MGDHSQRPATFDLGTEIITEVAAYYPVKVSSLPTAGWFSLALIFLSVAGVRPSEVTFYDAIKIVRCRYLSC